VGEECDDEIEEGPGAIPFIEDPATGTGVAEVGIDGGLDGALDEALDEVLDVVLDEVLDVVLDEVLDGELDEVLDDETEEDAGGIPFEDPEVCTAGVTTAAFAMPLIIPGASLGIGTLPLTPHPPVAIGHGGGERLGV
jgi:hypothetical protein